MGNKTSAMAGFKTELEKLLEACEALKTDMENYEPDSDDFENQYSGFLDEVFGPVTVGQLEFAASRVLKELDPIAYNIGISEYVDSLERSDYMSDATDANGDLFADKAVELRDEFEDISNKISDYDSEHDTAIEDELEDLIDEVESIINDIDYLRI